MFDLVVAHQLEGFGKEGDVAVGISTSGSSPHMLRALEVAKSKSIYTIAIRASTFGIGAGQFGLPRAN